MNKDQKDLLFAPCMEIMPSHEQFLPGLSQQETYVSSIILALSSRSLGIILCTWLIWPSFNRLELQNHTFSVQVQIWTSYRHWNTQTCNITNAFLTHYVGKSAQANTWAYLPSPSTKKHQVESRGSLLTSRGLNIVCTQSLNPSKYSSQPHDSIMKAYFPFF